MEKNNIPEVIDDLIIIPDTNILLYLYKCSFNSSQNIAELLNKVKDKVVVPSRVYKEYMAHKDEEQAKIDRKYDNFTKDLKKQVGELKGKICGSISESRKYDFPNCDELETGINTFLDKAVQAITTYEGSLSSEKQNKSVQITNVEQLIQYWDSQGMVLPEPNIVEIMEYVKEGEFRFRYKMPPGYMDEAEKDNEVKKDSKKDNFEGRIRKYGDLFVWKDVISVGKREQGKKYILFLTNDVKEDWWLLKGEQNNKEAVRMRDELLKEYIAETGSEKIEFMTLSKFYELFSDYYKICDIKTSLELDIDSYIRGYIIQKYQEEIEQYMEEQLMNVDLEDLNPEYYDALKPFFEVYDIEVREIGLHYDDEGETAIYEIAIEGETNTEQILRIEGGETSWIADMELQITVFAEIQRDLRNLDEDGIKFESAHIEVLSDREAWEVYLEMEDAAKADMDDTLEDYYNH